MDKIRIENLEVFAHHGVFPEETKLGQKFLVSITLNVNTRNAGKTDNLQQSVHYGEVSHFAAEFLQQHTYKLIEAAAEHLAEAILLEYPLVEQVTVLLQKPWAPIGLSLENVGVEITRGWKRAYLSFGSNMGDKEAYVRNGIEELSRLKQCQVEKVSSLFVTKPYGGVEQEDFVNGCLQVKTLYTPEELLDQLHEIERHANRERKVHWGPRTLDMDILMYENEVVQTQDLVIPHLDMPNRLFVLEPLCEIAPYLVHPINHRTVQQMLKRLKKSEV